VDINIFQPVNQSATVGNNRTQSYNFSLVASGQVALCRNEVVSRRLYDPVEKLSTNQEPVDVTQVSGQKHANGLQANLM
jgi:hypothetical protein